MDARGKRKPWTRKYLELIDARPTELALDLAQSVGGERLPFKADIRRKPAPGTSIVLVVIDPMPSIADSCCRTAPTSTPRLRRR